MAFEYRDWCIKGLNQGIVKTFLLLFYNPSDQGMVIPKSAEQRR